MLSKTWKGYLIEHRRGYQKLYVKSIYAGKVTWTLDYTYAKYFKSEKTARRIDENITDGIIRDKR